MLKLIYTAAIEYLLCASRFFVNIFSIIDSLFWKLLIIRYDAWRLIYLLAADLAWGGATEDGLLRERPAGAHGNGGGRVAAADGVKPAAAINHRRSNNRTDCQKVY